MLLVFVILALMGASAAESASISTLHVPTTTTTSTTRKAGCTIMTLGSIDLANTNFVPKIHTKKETGIQPGLQIQGLHYTYNACVDPSSVSFEVYQRNSLQHCDLTKSLNSVVQIRGTPQAQVADMTLQIDSGKMNGNALGAAYSSFDGSVVISLCVRARVSWQKQEILFREHNFEIRYLTKIDFSSGSIELCPPDSACNTVPKLEFSFEGDFAAIIGDRKALFLKECTVLLQTDGLKVACLDARPGSIIVTLSGEEGELAKAKSLFEDEGLKMKSFAPLKFTQMITTTTGIKVTTTTAILSNGIEVDTNKEKESSADIGLVVGIAAPLAGLIAILLVVTIIKCIRKDARKGGNKIVPTATARTDEHRPVHNSMTISMREDLKEVATSPSKSADLKEVATSPSKSADLKEVATSPSKKRRRKPRRSKSKAPATTPEPAVTPSSDSPSRRRKNRGSRKTIKKRTEKSVVTESVPNAFRNLASKTGTTEPNNDN